MVQMMIRPPEDLKETLSSEARRMGITLNALVLQILWDWVKRNSKELSGREWTRTDRTENQCNLFPDN